MRVLFLNHVNNLFVFYFKLFFFKIKFIYFKLFFRTSYKLNVNK